MTRKVTLTITPLQAHRIVQRDQAAGQVELKFKQRGQKGGFLPMLAALPGLASMAMPLLSGAASAVGSLAANTALKNLTGNGVCLTCTEKQMQKLKGHGLITANFRISKSKKNPQTMMGAGIADQLPQILLKPLQEAVKSAASKVAQKAGEVMANKTISQVFGNKSAPSPAKAVTKRKNQAGSGVRLAGHGVRLVDHGAHLAGTGRGAGVNLAGRRISQAGTGIVYDVQDISRSIKKQFEDAANSTKRFVVRKYET